MKLLFCVLVLAVQARPTLSWLFGSSTPVSGATIANTADKYVGSTKWSFASSHSTGTNTNKCNIFVADILDEAGAEVPQRYWLVWSPIGAGEWGNPSSTYLTDDDCYTRVFTAKVGDVIGDGVHVGIVTGTRTTTSAAHDKVLKNDWGFRAGQTGIVMWRYGC